MDQVLRINPVDAPDPRSKQAEAQQRQIAEEKTTEAQDNLKLAQAQEQKANASRDEAEKQKQKAEEAQAEAQMQRDAAHRQSYVANIVAAQANIQAGFYRGAQLTDQNGACGNCLAAVNFGSSPLTL